jgi:prepilin-type N-terminal cleavage/methylation domain-containing protein
MMKKGFTLIEMLVTVGLFTIIITIAIGGFLRAIATQREVSSLIAAQSNVSLTLEQMARQMRTGYLFCNSPYNETTGVFVSGKTASPPALPDCDCTYSVSPAPQGSWTCQAIDFYDSNSDEIRYQLSASGTIMESINSASPSAFQPVTGNDVSVKYLQFQLLGETEGDHWPPRITISIGIAPSSTDPAVSSDVSNLETTVSARTIDCDSQNGQC